MMREIGSMIFTLMNAVFLIRGLAGESLAAEAGLDVVRGEVDRAGITSRSDVAHWDVARDYPGRELIWQTASLRVTKWERDSPVPDGDFDVSLPPGTIVLEALTLRPAGCTGVFADPAPISVRHRGRCQTAVMSNGDRRRRLSFRDPWGETVAGAGRVLEFLGP